MIKAGNRCELIAHEGGKHGYFMFDRAFRRLTGERPVDYRRRIRDAAMREVPALT